MQKNSVVIEWVDINTILQKDYCEHCGNERTLTFVSYRKHTGLLFARRIESVEGWVCSKCNHKYFWVCQAHCLLAGWWGVISLLIGNPWALVGNILMYIRVLFRLKFSKLPEV